MRRRARTTSFGLWLSGLLLACSPSGDGGVATGSASAPSLASLAPQTELLEKVREAESSRRAEAVPREALRSADVRTRIEAARALARIAGPDARKTLLGSLADESPDVVKWAAYGVGYECARDPAWQTKNGPELDRVVSALAARATTLPDDASWDGAHEALLRALAGCFKSSAVEPTLVAWLPSERRGCAASLALGDLAMRTKKLREETWVTLLSRAAGSVSSPPCRAAFFAFARVPHLPPSVEPRFIEVAGGALGTPDPYRLMLIRSLSRGGAAAVPLLSRVLETEPASFTMPERLEAFRAALRIEKPASELVAKTLATWSKLEKSELAEGGDGVQLALAALAALPEGSRFEPQLQPLTVLELDAPSARQKRVLSMLRCRALAKWVASPHDPLLAKCDVETPSERKRASLAVLARTAVGPKELTMFEALAKDEDPLVQEAALSVLVKQEKLPRVPTLVRALAETRSGISIFALETLAEHPSLGARTSTKKAPDRKSEDEAKDGDVSTVEPDEALVTALGAALERGMKEQEPEMLDLAIRAIGAIGAQSLRAKVEPFCGSRQPSTREAAATALRLLSGTSPRCDAPTEDAKPVPFVESPAKAKLSFETDAGTLVLELDGREAPRATARFIVLVQRGYYAGNVLHRVDPSYVVQFGSPLGDGYGGPIEDAPLPCETGPFHYEEKSVGVALAGRDTGKSQLFVTRGRHPHIDGAYPLVGKASGPWERVIEGDVIQSARVDLD